MHARTNDTAPFPPLFLSLGFRQRLTTMAVTQDNKADISTFRMNKHPVMIISYEMYLRKVAEVKQCQFDLVICTATLTDIRHQF